MPAHPAVADRLRCDAGRWTQYARLAVRPGPGRAVTIRCHTCEEPDLRSNDQRSGLERHLHSADNGFCVLRLKVKGERKLVTLIGPRVTARQRMRPSTLSV